VSGSLPPLGELAARWFAEREEPGLRADGMPDDGIEHLRQYVIDGLLGDPEATRQVVAHYWQLCACGHFRGIHAAHDGECGGLDSYGQPCGCPSYDAEQDGPDDDPEGDPAVYDGLHGRP
jgi:hypothetical protein